MAAVGMAVLPLVSQAASAAPAITVEYISWNVVGLDSNDVTTGPDRFLQGARVCNTGDEPAVDLTTSFVWDSSNPYLAVEGPTSVTDATLDAGSCTDAYFLVTVARDAAAYDTTRAFHLEASAAGGVAATTGSIPLYVEHLISQNRNDAISIEGPRTVHVGGTYSYTATSSTAPQGYEQLVSFLDWPTTMFRIVDIDTSLSHPPGAVIDTTYADACGWDPDTRTCTGTGKAGGDIVTVYTVEVVAAGTATLRNLIYDFSGSSYHYNADFDADVPPLSSKITIEALEPPDLSITKDLDDQLVAGRSSTYALTVTNVGQSATVGEVTVTDELPEGLSFVAVEADGWDCGHAAGTVTCTTSQTIAAGQTVPMTLTVDVAGDAADTLTNVATVDTELDPRSDNDTATSTDPVLRPGLGISKTAEPSDGTPVAPGDRVTYTIEVSNPGDATTTGIVLADPLPAGVTAVSATLDGEEVALSELGSGLAMGDLAPGDRHVLTLVVDVDDDGVSEVVNTATVTADGPPPASDETRHPVETNPALSVAKTASSASVATGDRLTYTVTVTSDGAHAARDVVLADLMPDGTSYVVGSTAVDGAAYPDQGTDPLAAGLSLGDLEPGRVVTVTFDVTVDASASGVLVNVARATGSGAGETGMDDAVTTVDERGAELPATGIEERPWPVFWTAWASMLLGMLLVGSSHAIESSREV